MGPIVVSGLFSLPLELSKHAATGLAVGWSAGDRRADLKHSRRMQAPHSAGNSSKTAAEERFVAGPENQLVLTVAQAVAEEPPRFSPITIWGPTGIGKSLLLGLLVREYVAAHQGLTSADVLQICAADFARSYANAVDADAVEDWRLRHRRLRLLAIDDLQRLATKPAVQREFIHLLDHWQSTSALVMVTLRQTPSQVRGLSPMLASRLLGGLAFALQPPAAEARAQLVQDMADRQGLVVSPEMMSRLISDDAKRGSRLITVPQIRQAITQLVAQAQLENRPADERLLGQLLSSEKGEKRLTMRHIVMAVARHFHVTLADIKGQSRRQHLVHARGIAMVLSRQLTGCSYSDIGEFFSGRDHSTVLHACRKTESLLEQDAPLRHVCEELSLQLATQQVASGGSA
ncbi:MAG: helix-turn-helix domain-containing protein [Planctomycetaceae bacterium]